MTPRIVRGALCAVALASGPAAGNPPGAPAPRRFEITASRYVFTPSRVEVRQGDLVELVVHSADREHGLAIRAYGVDLRIPEGGAAVTARFVADKPDEFPFRCSRFCGLGHRRMKGELVVTAAGS